MNNCIEVRDSVNENFLSVALSDLLKKLNGKFEECYWSIYELIATAKKDCSINIPKLEKKISTLSTGLHMNWAELLILAEKLEQVTNLILVASVHEKDFTEFENNNEWRRKFPIVIEMVDGECWEIYSQSEELINFLSSSYQDTRVYSLKQ